MILKWQHFLQLPQKILPSLQKEKIFFARTNVFEEDWPGKWKNHPIQRRENFINLQKKQCHGKEVFSVQY